MARWMVLALLGVMGCDDGTPDTDPDSGTDSDTLSDTDTASGTEDDDLAVLSGKVVGVDGKGVQIRINMCQEICYTEFTGEDGSYKFRARFAPGDYWFYTVNGESNGKYSNMSVSLKVVEDDLVLTQNVTLPVVGATTPLPARAKEVELASGLYATLGLDSLKLLDKQDTRAGAVLLDPEHYPNVGYPGTVVAAWYMLPFQGEVLEGKTAAMRIVPAWGAKDGDSFDVYRGLYTWEKIGTYTVKNGEINIDDNPYISSIFVVESK